MKKKNRYSKNNVFIFTLNKSGQMIVEMVLLLSVFVLTATIALNKFETEIEPFDAFITGPWKVVPGLIESGTWKKKDEARTEHPNHFGRMYSVKGTPP